MPGRGSKKYYAVRVGFKPGLYIEWSEAEKQVTGYNGAEYCSFKLKREADKYLKTKKKKEQQKTDAQNNTQSDQRHDNDENTVSMQMKYRRKQMEYSNREMNVILS